VVNGYCLSRLLKKALACGSGSGRLPSNEKKRAGWSFEIEEEVLVGASRMRGVGLFPVVGGFL
jgi:hypothetical protein